jgi:hypothetical protein
VAGGLGGSSRCIVWKRPSQYFRNIRLPIEVRQIIRIVTKKDVYSATAMALTCSFVSVFSAVYLLLTKDIPKRLPNSPDVMDDGRGAGESL